MYKSVALTLLLTPTFLHPGLGDLILEKIETKVVRKTLKKIDPLLGNVNNIQPMTRHENIIGLPAALKSILIKNDSNARGIKDAKCQICNADSCDSNTHTKFYASTLAEGLISGTTTALTLQYLLKQSEQNGLAIVALQVGINVLAHAGINRYFNEKYSSNVSKLKHRVAGAGVKWGIKTALCNTPGINKQIMKHVLCEKHKMQSLAQGTLQTFAEKGARTALHRVSPQYVWQKNRTQHSKYRDYLFFQVPKTIGFVIGAYFACKYFEKPLSNASQAIACGIKDYTPDMFSKIVKITR